MSRMPRKTQAKAKKSNKGGRKPRQNSRKPLTKLATQAVQSMINKTLDVRAEDKFSLDTNYQSALANYDFNSQATFVDITPTINQGSGVAQREGNKVFIKGLKLAMRAIPSLAQTTVVAGAASGFASDPLYNRPAIRCFLIRVKHEVIVLQPVADMLGALAVRFRAPGVWKQDKQQNTLNSLAKNFKFLKSWTIPQKFNRAIVPVVNSSGIGNQEMDIFQIPTNSTFDQYCQMGQKVVFDDSTSRPRDDRYLLYCCWLDDRQDHTYSLKTPLQALDYRRCYIYEDS